MRIVVTSDSHRRAGDLMDIFERHLDNADLFINLGDGEDDVDNVLMLYPKIRIERVAGNCDWGSTLPLWKTVKFAGKTIFFSHGHPFSVKFGYERIVERAKAEGADICLFGHTHNPIVQRQGDMYLVNPGAVCDGKYAIIDIEPSGIMAYHARV